MQSTGFPKNLFIVLHFQVSCNTSETIFGVLKSPQIDKESVVHKSITKIYANKIFVYVSRQLITQLKAKQCICWS